MSPPKPKHIARLLAMLLLFALPDNRPALATQDGQVEFYTVIAGDTWPNIATRFGLALDILWQANGVTNPIQLQPGSRLYIPETGVSFTVSTSHIIEAGDGLAVIQAAVLSDNPISTIMLLNGLHNTTSGFGTVIYNRDKASMAASAPSISPTSAPPPTNPPPPTLPPTVVFSGPPLVRSQMGVQGYFTLFEPEIDQWLTRAQDAGFTWVKIQANWRVIETPPDVYPNLSVLDNFVRIAATHRLNILISVAKAPDWARVTTEMDGPPIREKYVDLFSFVQLLANRYKSNLDTIQIAFEIWNEPNTQRDWNGVPLSASEYVVLLSGSYVAIKSEDQRYIVISAGLSPTGINDGIQAIEDRTYLRQMYQAGLQKVVDAIGVHPYGWANPPDLRCCNDPSGPPVYNNDPHFFFLNTIEDYRAIQAEFDDQTRHQLWITEFGWGNMDGVAASMPASSPYFTYITADLQAQYVIRAYQIAQDWDFVGPMFLWNLNFATLSHFDPDHGAYSLFLPPDRPRPAYEALRDAPKVDHK